MTMKVNGVELYRANDMVVKDSHNGFFERETYHKWALSLNEEEMFIDVGAYTGIYSLVAASKGLKVISFEPNPYVYHRLVENIELNDKCHLISAYNVAAGPNHGTSKFYTKNFMMTSSGSLQENSEYDSIDVPMITLDSCLDSIDRRVGSMKIDVEGYELDVLKGASDLLLEHKPNLIIEILNEKEKRKIIDYLLCHNYNSYTVLDERNYFFEGA